MSNPLSLFRKYQKTMLAVAAVLAMFAFGILPMVGEWMGQSGGRGQGGGGFTGDTVAVSWQGGQLNEAELQNLRAVRTELVRFQQGVIAKTQERGGRPLSVVIPNTNSEASIVESILLAEEANRMGIHVGEDAVLQHLTQHLANDTIDSNELARILRDSTGGRIGQNQLFDTLKTELAAHQVRILANGAAFDGSIADTAVTPGQSFDYFRRMYRRMEAEVMPLPVEDFVAKVTEEPSQAEIEELYNEYKEAFPSPITPTPGFKEPFRARFQWLKADFTAFLDREIANLPEEDIKKYYEENKNSYKKIAFPDLDSPGAGNTGSTEESATDGESTSPELDDLQSGGEGADALQDDTDAEEVTDEIFTDEAEVDGNDAVESADPVETDEAEVTTDAAEGQEEVVEGTLSDFETATFGDTSNATSETANEGSEPEVEYQPLEEVRDEIARTLARPKASDAIEKAVNDATRELKKYFDDYMYWDTSPEEEKGAQPPLPDMKAIAEKLDMVSGEIPLISVYEADEYELGRAFELDFSTGQIRRMPFTQMGFSPSLALFRPRQISASDVDSKFVFWKVEQKEAFTPTLDEARPKIVQHWKMKKAIALAKAEGEKIAQKVRDGKQSLRTAFEEDASKITDTGQFTWMTFGATPMGQGAPRISSVEGVEFPGDDFMRAASSLDTGEVAITQNYPESTVYVVYMKGVTGNQEDLQTLFLNEGVKQPVLYMARQDNMRTASDWYMGMEKDWGIEWARPPGGR